jgi:hypothetical protein
MVKLALRERRLQSRHERRYVVGMNSRQGIARHPGQGQ